VATSSTKKPDPMLVCPDWCDLETHDQCEMLRDVHHWRDLLTLDVAASFPSKDVPETRVCVDVVQDAYRAPLEIRLGVGELQDGSAKLTVEQTTEVIRALQDAIAVVTEATP
jgi:uncharacterized protein DUF6907